MARRLATAVQFAVAVVGSRLPPLGFIGPFAPRNALRGASSEGPAEPAGRGLDEEEIRTLLGGREALVLAADNVDLGLAVAAGLAELGARVTFASRRSAATRACKAITRRCERQNGCGSCEAAHVDLADEASVWLFAESFSQDARPLHVLVNCADDAEPFYQQSACGWERTAGSNHLGPFLLTQLVLDQMVTTIRRDAAASATAAAAAAAAAAATARASKPRRGASPLPPPPPPPLPRSVQLRPSPAPLARVVTIGRRARPTLRRPSPVPGLRLTRANYSTWRAYGDAHEANLASALHLQRLLETVPTDAGDTVHVNVVHAGGGRWLPAPARRLLGLHKDAALSAIFLASTPLPGLSGLYFTDFASQPAWSKEGLALSSTSQRQLFMQRVYEASRQLTGAPPVEWLADVSAVLRAHAARARPAPAAIRAAPHDEPRSAAGDEAAQREERGATRESAARR